MWLLYEVLTVSFGWFGNLKIYYYSPYRMACENLLAVSYKFVVFNKILKMGLDETWIIE